MLAARLAVLGVRAWMLEHSRSKLDVKYLSTEVGLRKFFPQPYIDQHKPKELTKTISQGIKALQVSLARHIGCQFARMHA